MGGVCSPENNATSQCNTLLLGSCWAMVPVTMGMTTSPFFTRCSPFYMGDGGVCVCVLGVSNNCGDQQRTGPV